MFIVVFRNRKRAGFDSAAYARDAVWMEQLALQQPGYISFKTYVADDGEVVALSEWESEAQARDWAEHPDHRTIQQKSRDRYYESYTMYAANEPRTHQFDRGGA